MCETAFLKNVLLKINQNLCWCIREECDSRYLTTIELNSANFGHFPMVIKARVYSPGEQASSIPPSTSRQCSISLAILMAKNNTQRS